MAGSALTRDGLGRAGVWTFAFEGQPAGRVREAAAEIEELGYGALWYGEAFGRDTVGQAWLLLSATQRIVVASGIANIAFREPLAMAAAERTLGEAFPGRYLLGLGGHRVDDTAVEVDGYSVPTRGKALSTMRRYLEAMDAAPAHGPAPDVAPRRVLAALGPKMLALAAERAWGAHPYFVPVEHTASARRAMGPDAFLGVEQAVVLDTDIDRAREVAARHVAGYVTSAPHQTANARRMGFGDEDLAGGRPSRRLVDAIVAYGDVDVLHARVKAHLDAGADHVCVQVLTEDPAALPLPQWRELAPALVTG
ncbi:MULTISPECIES: TIGR03620 family F420-dependent LLM class oxidoreductase [Streptomyces]|uniref:TIGR03620 family F420-dependent LLM class oxidoreductase n=1 Tax=Streptomyces TaxID=1883 RepID=UPI001E2FCBB9|nr:MULTISPECIES: TIGR03620 family F420-dependent LLM class oxidoreductase [Streptomyces]UFQ18006.1 TIGR03620 family F420-dependent LLM class oxidoreductase [Streptomyces huasconensis]WCL87617.1 TIGR03620 family F420-dependent LLM class oxidoreductase [Streptomyces sp. JCM 35825]